MRAIAWWLRRKWQRFACFMGWHTPHRAGPRLFDGVNLIATCRRCSRPIMQDSQGNWFASSRQPEFLREGMVRKGGTSPRPTTPHPGPPSGQDGPNTQFDKIELHMKLGPPHTFPYRTCRACREER